MNDCLFCKIVDGKINATKLFENDDVIAFRDINPQAPQHILVIPRQHIATLNDLKQETSHLLGQMYLTAKEIATKEGFADKGYRTVMNCNADGGQTVFHIHLHVMGGRALAWPPG